MVCTHLTIKLIIVFQKISDTRSNWDGYSSDAGEGILAQFGVHIIKLLNQWISTFPQDFRDESMMRNLMAFTKALEQHDRSKFLKMPQMSN